MTKLLKSTYIALTLSMLAANHSALAQEMFIGQIMLTAANHCPRTTVEPKGQLLSIAQNQALYSLLGKRFGGDGKTTFALPQLSDITPKGLRYCIAIEGIYPQRH